MPDQPQSTEPVPVQLTRIEGTVNLIAYQMTEVKGEVSEVKSSVANLTGRVSALEIAAAAMAESKSEVNALRTRVGTLEHAHALASGGSTWLKAWLPTLIAALGVAVALGFGVKFN